MLSSVILSVYLLWARIKFDASILPTRLRLQKREPKDRKKVDYPMIFLSHIEDSYPADENDEIQGIRFFKEEMMKYTSVEKRMMSMA